MIVIVLFANYFRWKKTAGGPHLDQQRVQHAELSEDQSERDVARVVASLQHRGLAGRVVMLEAPILCVANPLRTRRRIRVLRCRRIRVLSGHSNQLLWLVVMHLLSPARTMQM